MTDLNGFNAETVDPFSGYESLPAGDYRIVIVASERKHSAAGNETLTLTYEVLDGEHRGRKIFDYINLWHPDERPRQIAERKLSSICRAVGVLRPKTSEQLQDKPFQVGVAVEERIDRPGFFSNRVTKYAEATSYFPYDDDEKKEKSGNSTNNAPWRKNR